MATTRPRPRRLPSSLRAALLVLSAASFEYILSKILAAHASTIVAEKAGAPAQGMVRERDKEGGEQSYARLGCKDVRM